MSPLKARTQLIAGTAVILAVASVFWALAARATYEEQVRILGQQLPVLARTAANALEPDTDPPATLTRVLEGLQVTPDSAAVVFGSDGRVLGQIGATDVVRTATTLPVGVVTARTDVDGVDRLWGVVARPDGRLRVAIARPTHIALDRVWPIWRRNFRIVFLGTLLVLTVLSIVIGRTTRGLRQLEDMAARVGRGDLSTPQPYPMPSQELAALQTQMAEMIGQLRDLQKQVVRQERLAAIGTLVSGVAHEISNPLQSILGSAQVMAARPDLPEPMRADLGVIQGECVRAGTIIRNLTRFTRQQSAGPTTFPLSDVVRWLTELWERRLVEQSIALELDDRASRPVNAVSAEIQQVALNFLVNAEYAVRAGTGRERKVIVRTRDAENGFVRFEVEDTGPGVPAADEERLFVPFFTTKPVGEGTGLGLSVSYGIIHSHNGCIGYERGALGGARFFFEIPAARPA